MLSLNRSEKAVGPRRTRLALPKALKKVTAGSEAESFQLEDNSFFPVTVQAQHARSKQQGASEAKEELTAHGLLHEMESYGVSARKIGTLTCRATQQRPHDMR